MEYLENNYIKCRNRFINIKKIHLYLGHSPEFLNEVLTSLIDRKIVFWLDAHRYTPYGSGDYNYNECPVIQELKEIKNKKLKFKPIIFIDDYNLFDRRVRGFPELNRLYAGLENFKVEIYKDIIIAC